MSDIYGGAITNLFKQLLGVIDKGLDQLAKYGIKVTDKEVEETEDGKQKIRYTVTMGNNDDEVYVQVIHDEETDKCSVQVVDKKGNKMKQDNVKPKNIDEVIRKFGIKYYDTDSFVKESRRFSVTLQKVVGSRETSIELVNVLCSGFSGDEAYQALDTALDSDEFIDMIEEDPKSFEFIDYGDDYDIQPVELIEDCCSIDDPMVDILKSVYSLWNVSNLCLYNCRGQDVMNIRSIAEEVRWGCQSYMDTLNSIWSQTSIIQSPVSIIHMLPDADMSDMKQALATEVSALINKLACYYCIIPFEYQTTLNDWMICLKKQLDTLERMI